MKIMNHKMKNKKMSWGLKEMIANFFKIHSDNLKEIEHRRKYYLWRDNKFSGICKEKKWDIIRL